MADKMTKVIIEREGTYEITFQAVLKIEGQRAAITQYRHVAFLESGWTVEGDDLLHIFYLGAS